MPDHQSNRPASSGMQGYLEHAAFRAGAGTSGIGAAVFRSAYAQGLHRWDVIVSDGRDHHYIYLTGDLGPRPNLSALEIEEATERLAASLPGPDRLRLLAGASPLRVDRSGRVAR